MVERLRVRVLGGFAVDGLSERGLGSLKARRLVKVLALARGRPVSADRLADILWGDEQPARPAEQVGVLVSRLRGVLGADRLARTDAGYALAVDWMDLDELAARVLEAEDALQGGRLGAARAAAAAAAALARGTVLPEEEGDWIEVERAAAEARSRSARRIAVEAAGRAGDHAAAAAVAEDALAHDPYDEASLRVLMRAHAATGRPASALAAYVRLRERLSEDLGISPTADTELIHDAIVLGEARPASVADAPAARAPLPGRSAELAALNAALDRVVAGATVTVAIAGEAGIGKSALLDDWTARAATGALVLFGRCDQLGRDLPLQPIIDAVDLHLSGRSSDERIAVLGADAAAIGPLLGIQTAGAEGGATFVADPELGRARLFAALLGVIGRLADGRPVVLAIDDLHLAGTSTLAWLAFSVRRTQRLLAVVATRPTAEPLVQADVTLSLGPLDLEATASLVGKVRAAELHARSGGHPLLLTALAKGTDDELPASVHDAVDRRIAGLGPAALTIRTAAVLGADIDLDLLAEVMGRPAVELLGHLEAAAAGGVLVERGTGFAFHHELEREALDLAAGSARRALAHREAARTLAARSTPDPLAVAVHARLGGDVVLAGEWYRRAAEVAISRHDLDAADTHLSAALALADTAATSAARARVRMAGGRLGEAADDAARAVTSGGGAAALEVAGWVAYYRRRYDEARQRADEGLAVAADPALRVSCLALAGRVRHAGGDVAGAVAHLEAAVVEAAPAPVRGLAGVWLAQIRLHQGLPTDALALLDWALVEPERLAHPFAPLHGRFARAVAFGQSGRVDEALAACDDLEAAVARVGDAGLRMVGPAMNTRAWLLRWTGHPERADDLNTEAVERTDPRGPLAEPYFAGLLDLADGRLLADDPDGAASLAEKLATIETWQGTMAWHQRHRWGLVQARLALAVGDRGTAAERSAEVAADAGARGARRYQLLATALGALAGGEPASDLEQLDEVVRGLADCAALEGWPLVGALAAAFDVRAWRTEAERGVLAVIASASDQESARAFAARVLG
ncbi:MAG TPA: AAA family ATPase [Acidimicrobiales bacterium]|nr:AAA family ATPase [Acidimicrobiales bacterium]